MKALRRNRLVVLSLMPVLAGWPADLPAQQAPRTSSPPPAAVDDGNSVHQRWLALYRQQAESMVVGIPDRPDAALKLGSDPILTYTNAVRGPQPHGSVWLWTEQGRPVLIAAFWSARKLTDLTIRHLSLEWHSLADANVSVSYRGGPWWESQEPGLNWLPFPDAPRPAANATLRLTQMRALARRIRAKVTPSESDLRLMPQPLYRYPRTAGVIDGAIFALAMETDPEVLICLEARPDDQGKRAWYVGIAQFTNFAISVGTDGGDSLFEGDRVPPERRTGKHHLWFGIEEYPGDLSGLPASASPDASPSTKLPGPRNDQ